MIALDLGHHRKLNVWLDELPEIRYRAVRVHEQRYAAERQESADVRRAALEILVPRGGRAQYGLLGGEFEPATSDQFIVRLALSDRHERHIPWSLSARIDGVRAGIPTEYASGVIEDLAAGPAVLGAGVLRPDCGAHSAAGSSVLFFKRLAELLVRMLALKDHTMPESIAASYFGD